MAVKNIWSLNIDEAIAIDKIRTKLKKKNVEIFLPSNLQLKDIDLLLVDLKKMKIKTIQVKGSRTYEPSKKEREKYGRGSAAWFTIAEQSILNPTNRVDYFIFVLHCLVDGSTKKEIEINYLIIPTNDLKKIISKKWKTNKGKHHFFIWMDGKGKRSFDFYGSKRPPILLSKYLNNWDLLR